MEPPAPADLTAFSGRHNLLRLPALIEFGGRFPVLRGAVLIRPACPNRLPGATRSSAAPAWRVDYCI